MTPFTTLVPRCRVAATNTYSKGGSNRCVANNLKVSIKCAAPACQLITTYHIECKASEVEHGYSISRHNLHCQQMVNYLAVPACLSLRSKLAACLPVVKVSTGCFPTVESVVCVALYGLVRHSSSLEKSLTQQEAFVSNFCLKASVCYQSGGQNNLL